MDFINELSEANPEKFYMYVSLLVGFLYGFIAQREQFCFSGGIKDFVLFKQTKRTASLLVAMSTFPANSKPASHTWAWWFGHVFLPALPTSKMWHPLQSPSTSQGTGR